MSAALETTRVVTRRRAATVVLSLVAGLIALVVSAPPASAVVFTNSTPISVADGKFCLNCTDPGVGSPYPSNITVSGMSGTVTDVSVTLSNVTHAFPADFDVLLVGPAGQKLVLVSDSGTGTTSNATVTLSDAAAAAMPATGAWASGTFRPTDRASGPAEIFPSPAPGGSYGSPAPAGSETFASVFGGAAPNGTWSLYVVDDSLGDTGSLAGGWSLNITTASLQATTTTLTSSTNPSTTGQPVSFTATVTAGGSPASGNVTFKDGPTTLATVPLNASGQASLATSALTEGSHTITASYNGDATRAPSSGTIQQTVVNPTTKVGDAFCNTGNLAIRDGAGGPGAGRPYPSHVTTTGLTGVVDAVQLSLNGVTHPAANDIDVLLVGPGGQKLVVVSDAGGPTALASVSPTFRDSAATAFGTSGGWGPSSRPVNHGSGDVFPAPAPAGPLPEPAPVGTATFSSQFGGTPPNGQWSLYVADDALGGEGSISGGWCLEVATRIPVVAQPDSYATEKNTARTVPAPGVLANDTPPGVTAVPISAGPTTQGGTVTLTANGGFTYTPATGFTGTDTFSYVATDGVTEDSATVTVQVTNAPTVTGASMSRRQGAAATSSTVATVDDAETAAGNLTVTLGTLPAGISVTGLTNTAGTVTALVGASCTAATGNRLVPLTVTDADGYDTDGSFTVNVLPNAAPTLTYATANRTAGIASTVDPSTGPSDDGGAPTMSIVAAGTTYPGAVSVAPNGRVSLPAAPTGDYVVRVRATDDCGVATTTDLNVHVTSAPTLTGNTLTRRQGAAGAATIATVADTETAPGALTVTLGAVPSGLSVTGVTNTAGAVTALVSASCSAATGSRVVPLTVTDGDGNSTDGSFTVDVVANAAPTLTYASAERLAGQASTVDPATGPSDDGGTPTLTVVAASTTYPGAVTVAPNGRVSLPAAPAGSYVVRVRAEDGCGVATTADFSVRVTNPPTLVGSTVTRRQGAAGAATIATVTDTETAPGALTVTLGAVPSGLSVTGVTNTGGTVTALVSASCTAATGDRTVPLTVTDGDGNSTDGSFTVHVVANAAPTLTYAAATRNAGVASTVDPSTGPSDDGGAPTLSIVPAATTYPGAVSVAPNGRVSLPAAAVGDYVVRVRAEDGCGAVTLADLAVEVASGNAAPVADAGGPYAIAEGEGLALDGSASTDPDADGLVFSWDLDNDGTFGDATGATPTLTWAQLTALGIDDGAQAYDVTLRVGDGALTDLDTVPVQVSNVAPSAAGPASADAVLDQALTLGVSATDASPADTAAGFSWSVDWGDGTSGSSLTHTYSQLGTFVATATATDKDSGTSNVVEVLVTVSGADNTGNPCGTGRALVVSGTSGADDILVRDLPGGDFVVEGLGSPQHFTNIALVEVRGNGGDDTITLSPEFGVRRFLYGGDGDDAVVGSRGADVLVGGDGSDVLKGKKGRDLLIGGDGADDLRGGKGSDLLVAGTTSYDDLGSEGIQSLCGLRSEWTDQAPYAQRIGRLDDLSGGPGLVPGSTAFDDGGADALTGAAGTDWFLLNRTGAGVLDTSDRAPGETATDL